MYTRWCTQSGPACRALCNILSRTVKSDHYQLYALLTGPDVSDNMMTTESIAGMLMLILQHCKDPKLHTMFIESLLPLRDHLYKDLFTVISYGPPNTKIPAVKLLFHYWPQLLALLPSHGSSFSENYEVTPWSVPICQRDHCINKIAKPSASKVSIIVLLMQLECSLWAIIGKTVVQNSDPVTQQILSNNIKYNIINFL